jgi:hypothetical protein
VRLAGEDLTGGRAAARPRPDRISQLPLAKVHLVSYLEAASEDLYANRGNTMSTEQRTPSSFGESLEHLLSRLRAESHDLLRTGVTAGTIGIAALTGVAGCNEDGDTTGDDTIDTPSVPVPGSDKADWAQLEGKRDTSMVVFQGDYWTERAPCYDRFCSALDVMVKVHIKPVEGANQSTKRIGVVVSRPGSGESQTYVGSYFSTNNGLEEWHVRVGSRTNYTSQYPLFVFTAWYQDGKGNTWYDDNKGEFHAVCAGDRYRVISQAWCCTDPVTKVLLDDNGVSGKIVATIADLDYDKELALVWTTDDWATVNTSAMGGPDELNKWHWVNDSWGGADIWEINLAIPGSFTKFEYAIVYRHGVTNDAKVYEFWDNNGGRNYVVTKADPDLSPTNPGND